MAAVFKGQQGAVDAAGVFPNGAHAFFVQRYHILGPGHEQHGDLDALQAFGIPETRVHAPGADRDGGLDPWVGQVVMRLGPRLMDAQGYRCGVIAFRSFTVDAGIDERPLTHRPQENSHRLAGNE